MKRLPHRRLGAHIEVDIASLNNGITWSRPNWIR